jgi:nicotinate-nucleotide pyrophosphorylase (carboxylating)
VPLPPEAYRALVREALAEDLGDGDLTSLATVDDHPATGVLIARGALVVCGLAVSAEVFRQMDGEVSFHPHVDDGADASEGQVLATVSGRARALLAAERTALNFLQRLSGIATLTSRYAAAAGGRIVVLDTRKTTPTFRALEKYAVRCGGGTNHRLRLDDGLLIKDNHKRLAGGVGPAVARALAHADGLDVEVEVETLDEVEAALAAGAPRILLDNFCTSDIRTAVARIAGRARVEISGGVTLERMAELAGTGADFVSVGALTHSAPAADISFEIAG